MTTMVVPAVQRRKWRKLTFMLYDASAICAALGVAFMLRMNGHIPPAMLHGMTINLPVFLVTGLVVFHLCGVYDRMWRLGSLNDLVALGKCDVQPPIGANRNVRLVGDAVTLPALDQYLT